VIAMLSWFRRWRAARAARPEEPEPEAQADDDPDPPLGDELDLHTFLPKECADVVTEYVRAAQEAGLTTVRIVHGKGTGTLRRIVHGVLDRHPAVRAYRLAGAERGSWGATLVELVPRSDDLGTSGTARA
jgi:DNA-nicking Smr family endonuclease